MTDHMTLAEATPCADDGDPGGTWRASCTCGWSESGTYNGDRSAMSPAPRWREEALAWAEDCATNHLRPLTLSRGAHDDWSMNQT